MPQTQVHVFQEKNEESPLLEWLQQLRENEPRAFAKCLAVIQRLSQLGNELRRPTSDALRGGIRELRTKVGTVNYRILYTFFGKNAAVLTHGLTKEKKVPASEIDLAIHRRKLVISDPTTYTREFEV